MHSPILNRDFQHPDDGWYMIEPKGTHPNRAAGAVQVIDDEAARSIVLNFNADAAQGKLSHGREMLVDREHWKHDLDKETTAYGWLFKLQNRDDGIYGKIRWTGTGQSAVDGGDYRFFSTEYDNGDLEVLNDGSPKRVRPLRLDGLTLTNDPNNKGGAPITNRQGGGPDTKDHSLVPGPENFPTPQLDKWFAAVVSVQQSAETHGKIGLDWGTAWTMAKQQFPDLYAAAFGGAEKNAESGATDTATASQQVAMLSNRVCRAAGMGVYAAFKFLEAEVPAVFNRAKSTVRDNKAVNQTYAAGGCHNAKVLQNRAAAMIGRLAAVEQKDSRMPAGVAWAAVVRREPVLAGLANGTLSPEEAFAQDSTIKNRLI